jgi:SAP domain.
MLKSIEKMLSELAIFAPEEFAKLVNLSKDALEGKAPKKEAKEVEAKVEKITKEKVDYSKLTVAELKELCASKNIEVTSSMKKADLVDALNK